MTSCVLCGSNSASRVFSKDMPGEDMTITLLRCGACGHVYLADWSTYLTDTLYDYYGDAGRRLAERNPITSARCVSLLESFGKPGRLIDVGCGAGHFVEEACAAGWDAQGIELSQPAVDLCQSLGLPVSKMDLFSDHLVPASFDVVTAFEVVEHVPNPSEFIKRMAELLKPGGLLHITLPNWASLDRVILGNQWHAAHYEHISYFTPGRLKSVLRDAGLKVEKITAHNISPAALKKLAGRAPPADIDGRGEIYELRETIERKRSLRAAKTVANTALAMFNAGKSMKVWARA